MFIVREVRKLRGGMVEHKSCRIEGDGILGSVYIFDANMTRTMNEVLVSDSGLCVHVDALVCSPCFIGDIGEVKCCIRERWIAINRHLRQLNQAEARVI